MKKSLFLTLVYILSWSILLVGCAQVNGSKLEEGKQLQEDNQQEEPSREEEKVRALVERFGQTLKQVPLLASDEIIKESIERNYREFLSPSLRSEWFSDPQSALGRTVSSPWPDRIEISDIEKTSDNTYEVKGKVIEITSVEQENGGSAAERPITLIIQRMDDLYRIDHVSLGDYEVDDTIIYKNTEYGFAFSLPVSWKDYQIVMDTWKGTSVNSSQTSGMVESGPNLFIRHPKWTSENPRQDIPILIFTHSQWSSLQQEEFHIGAAPIGPRELGRNSKYIFALPARYNFAFPEGYEEVEGILESDALQPFETE